jgi:hypothetical protein
MWPNVRDETPRSGRVTFPADRRANQPAAAGRLSSGGLGFTALAVG